MQKDHQESTEANSVPKKCIAQLKLITAYIDFNHRRMLTNRRTLSCNTLGIAVKCIKVKKIRD